MRCQPSKEIFYYIRQEQSIFNKKNTSFCKQLNGLEKHLFINCLEYDLNTVKSLIAFSFKCVNTGLVDSVKFVIGKISKFMELNLEFFDLYNLLKNFLRLDFRIT